MLFQHNPQSRHPNCLHTHHPANFQFKNTSLLLMQVGMKINRWTNVFTSSVGQNGRLFLLLERDRKKKDRNVTSEIPTPVCDIWQKVNKRSYENSRSIIDFYAVCVVKGQLKIPFCLSDAGKTRDFCVA